MLFFSNILNLELKTDRQVIEIAAKDGRRILLHVHEERTCERILEMLSKLSFLDNVEESFAFIHFANLIIGQQFPNRSCPYILQPSLQQEYQRLISISQTGWRISAVNA